MRPHKSLGTRQAAQVAAEQVNAVLRSVLNGPQKPAAGYFVDLKNFRRSLPLFRWNDLTNSAHHFGKCGAVLPEVSGQVAAEVANRINAAAGPRGQREQNIPMVMSREITTICYSFSKLKPQLPEYQPLYQAVAAGIERNAWDLNTLQLAQIGTALADAGERSALDVLPAIARAAINQMKDFGIDELRYTLHVAANARPGLDAEAIVVLASKAAVATGTDNNTKRDLATFAELAHMLVSLLQIEPPQGHADVTRVHRESLDAIVLKLGKLKPSSPAHPLPTGGMAPILANFIKRAENHEVLPLTPPVFSRIIEGLLRISKGFRPNAKNNSLNFSDWVSIMGTIADFCAAHSARPAVHKGELPNWTHVAFRHTLQVAKSGDAPPDLHSLLTLSRMVLRFGLPPQTDQFFPWAADQVQAIVADGNADGIENRNVLAALVSELVPALPYAKRVQLAKTLAVARPKAQHKPQQKDQIQTKRLLSKTSGILMPTLSKPVCDSEARFRPAPTPAESLWGKLVAPVTNIERSRLPQAASGKVEAERVSDIQVSTAEFDIATQRAATEQVENSRGSKVARADLESLHDKLQQALQRVEALESKLERQIEERSECQALTKVETKMTSSKSKSTEGEGSCKPPAFFSIFSPSAILSSGLGAAVVAANPNPVANILHVGQPFSFDTIRRAESPKVQAERLRSVFPRDHLPAWPPIKK